MLRASISCVDRVACTDPLSSHTYFLCVPFTGFLLSFISHLYPSLTNLGAFSVD